MTPAQGTLTSGGTGTLQFDQAGNMTGITSATVSPDGKSDILTVSNLPDGAANLTLNWNFYNTDGTPKFTQYSAASSPSSNSQDGQIASELTSVSLGSAGQVLAQYASGPQQVVGVLAMATVRNPTSLLGPPTTISNWEPAPPFPRSVRQEPAAAERCPADLWRAPRLISLPSSRIYFATSAAIRLTRASSRYLTR